MINLDRLVTWLNQTTLQKTNNPLYQVIITLIKAAQEFQAEQAATNTASSGAITGLENADFLTHDDESILLPNSRQLIAGTNVAFDDTVVNRRTVNVTSFGPDDGYWTPLTDGDEDETDLIFANGESIAVFVPTP